MYTTEIILVAFPPLNSQKTILWGPKRSHKCLKWEFLGPCLWRPKISYQIVLCFWGIIQCIVKLLFYQIYSVFFFQVCVLFSVALAHTFLKKIWLKTHIFTCIWCGLKSNSIFKARDSPFWREKSKLVKG